MAFQFQPISVCGFIDAKMDAANEPSVAKDLDAGSMHGDALHFLGYRLDRRGHTLEREGAKQHLEPLGFALLCYLIANRDRVVSKRELLDEVWPTRFVTENVVARCVMKVRRALKAGRVGPQVIVTLHRVGYRFVALLEDRGDQTAMRAAPEGRPDGGGPQADCRRSCRLPGPIG